MTDGESWKAEFERAQAERERLLAAAHAQAQRQAALFRLSAELAAAMDEAEICHCVVNGLHATLGYDVLALMLVDLATGDRVLTASVGFVELPSRLQPGEGLSGRPLLDGNAHYTPDVAQDPRYIPGLGGAEMGGAEVDVPIPIGGEVLGVLIAESQRPHAFDKDDIEVLTAAAQQAGLAIGKARLLAAERERADELDALRTTMANITAELELPTLLQAIVERAASLLNATGGELGLYDEASQEIRIVVSHNLGADYVGTRHAAGEGAMGRAVRAREPLIIHDYQTWEGRIPQYTQVHAVLVAPLEVGGRLLGVFTTASTDPTRRFTPADMHLLNSFAQQAAIAINNARLYDQAQQEIAERVRAEAELRTYQEHLAELVDERTAELRESEERYRTLFGGIPVGLYRTTPAGQIIDANPAQVHMLGYPSREQFLAINSSDLYRDPDERVRWQALMEREGIVRDFEARLRRHDDTIIWVNESARAVKDEQGQVLYYEGSMEDITERKQAEAKVREYQEHLEELVRERTAELRESEERYRTLFDGVPVGLYRTTAEGQLVDANRALVEMVGFPNRESLLADFDAASFYADPEERLRWQALMEQEGLVRDFEFQHRRYDGTVIWVNDKARAVKDEQGQVLHYEGSLEDITARRELEAEIRRQKDYYEALFVNNPVAVVTADLEGKVVSWNPMAEKLFGYRAEEVIGKSLNDFVANDDSLRAEASAYTSQVINEGRVQVITKRTRKDSSLVDVELLALPVIVAGKEVGFIAIYVDITALQAARRQAEAANQAKSVFLANMSHELRTPLNAILGFSQLMDQDPNLTLDQLDYLSIINQSGEHLLSLINDVLEISKIEAGEMALRERSYDLHRQLDGLEEIFSLRAREKGLRLSVSRDENVPQYVVADEAKLGQVLGNLLGNAVKFTQEGSVTLRVTAPSLTLARPQARETLHFEVADTGPGVAPEELPTIFDAFVQTETGRRALEGTGLGLTISRQFVRLMGGDLTASSQLGQGSCFQFDLQVGLAAGEEAGAQLVRARRRVVGLEPDQPIYRLLVVDEVETSRLLLVKLFQPMGFEVQEAANGKEAIEVWERWEPHLIWMDMRMPVMDGYEATRRIKATRRGQSTVIIALTASAFEDDRERILSCGCDDFVRKPFRAEEVFDVLIRHLGVRFVHKDLEAPESPAALDHFVAQDADAEFAGRLAALPPEWVTRLQEATTLGELGLITELIDQIGGHDAELAEELATMARQFEHGRILSLIQLAGEK